MAKKNVVKHETVKRISDMLKENRGDIDKMLKSEKWYNMETHFLRSFERDNLDQIIDLVSEGKTVDEINFILKGDISTMSKKEKKEMTVDEMILEDAPQEVKDEFLLNKNLIETEPVDVEVGKDEDNKETVAEMVDKIITDTVTSSIDSLSKTLEEIGVNIKSENTENLNTVSDEAKDNDESVDNEGTDDENVSENMVINKELVEDKEELIKSSLQKLVEQILSKNLNKIKEVASDIAKSLQDKENVSETKKQGTGDSFINELTSIRDMLKPVIDAELENGCYYAAVRLRKDINNAILRYNIRNVQYTTREEVSDENIPGLSGDDKGRIAPFTASPSQAKHIAEIMPDLFTYDLYTDINKDNIRNVLRGNENFSNSYFKGYINYLKALVLNVLNEFKNDSKETVTA